MWSHLHSGQPGRAAIGWTLSLRWKLQLAWGDRGPRGISTVTGKAAEAVASVCLYPQEFFAFNYWVDFLT